MLVALVLAAGRSRRMGTQKLLLPLEGRPVIARVVDEVLCGPVDRVLVIVGFEGRAIADALAGRPVEFVTNPDVEGEMLSSVRCGLRAVAEECSGVMVVLGDQPGITGEMVRMLVQAFKTRGRGIVVPVYDGRRGHPVVFAEQYREEILGQYGDVGLRGLLQAHPEEVLEVEVGSAGVLEDIDLPEDYERVTRALGRRAKEKG